MDLGNFSKKTKVINGEVVEDTITAGTGTPAPSFSKFLIVGIVIGAVFKWFK